MAVRMRDLENITSEIGEMTTAILDSPLFDILDSFDEKLNETAKFLRSYMERTENLLKFIRASREPNFLLHLSSLHTNVKYFFAHDLYKYARLTPYYLANMAELKQRSRNMDCYRNKRDIFGFQVRYPLLWFRR